jgi:hypothetical protein
MDVRLGSVKAVDRRFTAPVDASWLHFLDRELKDKRANLHVIAVVQGAFAHDARAVDESTVRAAQVLEADFVINHTEKAMLAANPGTVGPDVAFVSTANYVFAIRQREKLSLGLAADDK